MNRREKISRKINHFRECGKETELNFKVMLNNRRTKIRSFFAGMIRKKFGIFFSRFEFEKKF